VLGMLALLFMIFCSPENPKWLLSKGRRAEAICAFNQIALFNGSVNRIERDAIFVEFEDCDGSKNTTVLTELSRLIETEKKVPFS
jgi:hypothetical protein